MESFTGSMAKDQLKSINKAKKSIKVDDEMKKPLLLSDDEEIKDN